MWTKLLTNIGVTVLLKMVEYLTSWLTRWFKKKERDNDIDEAFKDENGQSAAAELDNIIGK